MLNLPEHDQTGYFHYFHQYAAESNGLPALPDPYTSTPSLHDSYREMHNSFSQLAPFPYPSFETHDYNHHHHQSGTTSLGTIGDHPDVVYGYYEPFDMPQHPHQYVSPYQQSFHTETSGLTPQAFSLTEESPFLSPSNSHGLTQFPSSLHEAHAWQGASQQEKTHITNSEEQQNEQTISNRETSPHPPRVSQEDWQLTYNIHQLRTLYSYMFDAWLGEKSSMEPIQRAFYILNTLIQEKPEIANSLINGDLQVVKKMAIASKPSVNHKSTKTEARHPYSKEGFLAWVFAPKVRDGVGNVSIGPVAKDVKARARKGTQKRPMRAWLPTHMGLKEQNEIIQVIMRANRIVEGTLDNYIRFLSISKVHSYIPRILDEDQQDADRAARELWTEARVAYQAKRKDSRNKMDAREGHPKDDQSRPHSEVAMNQRET